jgi:hypothetical protein
MAVDVDLIRAYTNGGVYTTDPGVTAPAPTNASSSLDILFKEIGAIGEDGISETSSQDTTPIVIWQNGATARKIRGSFERQYTFAAAEMNDVVAGIQWSGSTITKTAEGLEIDERPPGTDIRQWVLHGIDGTKAERIYIPKGEVTERGDVVWSSGAITVREWTLSVYVDGETITKRWLLDEDLAI